MSVFVIFCLGCPLSEGGFGQSHLEVLGCFGVSDSFVFLACTCDVSWKEELHVRFVTSRGREQDFYGKDGGLILASKIEWRQIEWRQSLNPDHPVLKVCTMCIHVSLSCCVLVPKKTTHQKQHLPFPTKQKGEKPTFFLLALLRWSFSARVPGDWSQPLCASIDWLGCSRCLLNLTRCKE